MTNTTLKKITKAEIRACFLDGAIGARYSAYEAIENCEDNGTCNFDMCIFKKEPYFTYAEYVQIFAEAGLKVRKYSTGWLCVNEIHGQANRNTVFHRTLAKELAENGYKTSIHYQMD